ncbi:hypothetical protein ACI09M_002215 [Cronobacter dublinensis]
MAGWGRENNNHWAAEQFDIYGFRRADLKEFAEKIGIDLDAPLEKINGIEQQNRKEVISETDVNLLRKEIASLKEEINNLKQEKPILLGKYRSDDPLLLAIEIRNKEWINYDPDNDRSTRGNQAAIKQELEERGFTSRQAESIELVACPIKR